jgi:hypothetical protein
MITLSIGIIISSSRGGTDMNNIAHSSTPIDIDIIVVFVP